MSLTKLSPNKWHVKVSVWDKNKKYPISKQKTVTGTRAEAVTAESDMLKELKSRSVTSAHASTFGEAVDLYMDNLRQRGRLSERHEMNINRVHRDLGHVRLEVFAERFEVWRRHLLVKPGRYGATLSGASVNRYTGIVRAVFSRLVKLEIIDKNPIASLRFPKYKEDRRDRYLTQEEWLRLLAAIKEHRPYILPIVQFMMAVPCRKSELVEAKRDQYNPFIQTIYIPDTKAGIPVNKPIPPDMVDYFKSIPADCGWLFYRDGGVDRKTRKKIYLPLTNLRYAWRYCLKKAGIADMRIHDLRHMSATDLCASGVPERVIMDVAGWKTPMLSTYWHKNSLKSAQSIREIWKLAAEKTDFIQVASS